MKSQRIALVSVALVAGLTVVLLFVPLTGMAQGQNSVIGRWVPVDGNSLTLDFDDRGSVTSTLKLPGGAGTYRLEGNRLTFVWDDGSRASTEISLARDTMLWKWSGPASRVQLTRTGPRGDETQPLLGTWSVVGGTPGYFQLSEFLPDGRFQNYSGYVGRYSVVGDLVTITVPPPPQPSSTDRYRLAGQGPNATLVPLEASPILHRPTLRRAPVKP